MKPKEFFDPKDPIVNFEIAELAYDKGVRYVNESMPFYLKDGHFHEYKPPWVDVEGYLAPTLYQLQRWLREVHNIHIQIGLGGFDNTYHAFISTHGYIYVHQEQNCMWEFNSYEEALEAALLIGLKQIK